MKSIACTLFASATMAISLQNQPMTAGAIQTAAMAHDTTHWTTGTKKPVPCLKVPSAETVKAMFEKLDKDGSTKLDNKELAVFVREAGNSLREFITPKEEREFWPKVLKLMNKSENDKNHTWSLTEGTNFFTAAINTVNAKTGSCKPGVKAEDVGAMALAHFCWETDKTKCKPATATLAEIQP